MMLGRDAANLPTAFEMKVSAPCYEDAERKDRGRRGPPIVT